MLFVFTRKNQVTEKKWLIFIYHIHLRYHLHLLKYTYFNKPTIYKRKNNLVSLSHTVLLAFLRLSKYVFKGNRYCLQMLKMLLYQPEISRFPDMFTAMTQISTVNAVYMSIQIYQTYIKGSLRITFFRIRTQNTFIFSKPSRQIYLWFPVHLLFQQAGRKPNCNKKN